jgi:DNA repair protein RadC
MPTEKHLTVKSWSPEDRPREKMLQKGPSNVTDTELLAILLGSGSRNETVIELSRKLLMNSQNNLNELSRLSICDLMKTKGIGQAKALIIAAAFELGKRHCIVDVLHKDKILTSRNIAEIFQARLGNIPHEEFWLVLLNRSNKIIDKIKISQGGISGTVADIRIMLKEAIEKLASAIVLCHNHPSGNIQPSEQDISLTKKIKEAGLLMDISLLDHVIVSGENEYFSFADEGLL